MLEKLSEKIAKSWSENGITDPSLTEVYRYGIEITLSSILGIVLVTLTGAIFFSVWDAAVFLLTFIPIRSYCGGYHANTYLACNLSMICTFSAVALCAEHLAPSVYHIALSGVAGACIVLLFCPVENRYKPLDKHQKKKCKLISLVFLEALVCVCSALYYAELRLYKVVLFTIAAVLCMVPVGMIKNYAERRNDHEERIQGSCKHRTGSG